jgi:regulatory protein
VDDAAFARQWVETRAPRGYGATRLRVELRARGVAAALIERALAAVTPDAMLARARDTARRRLPALARGRPDRVAARLRDHLLRRGFPPGAVARVVREALGAIAEE